MLEHPEIIFPTLAEISPCSGDSPNFQLECLTKVLGPLSFLGPLQPNLRPPLVHDDPDNDRDALAVIPDKPPLVSATSVNADTSSTSAYMYTIDPYTSTVHVTLP